MTSSELKSLVKEYFNLVEAEVAVEETVTEEFAAEETVSEEITEETFGELKDENGAFTIKFPGDSLQIGDKVTVVTTEGQEMDAPDGEHRLEDGTMIVTKDSVVEEIISADDEKVLAAEEGVEEAPVEEEAEMEEVVVEIEEEEPSLEDIVKEIADAVAEQMKSMEEKMSALEEKVDSILDTPAAEPTVTAMSKDIKSKFTKFDVSNAANSKQMEMAIRMIKNKK